MLAAIEVEKLRSPTRESDTHSARTAQVYARAGVSAKMQIRRIFGGWELKRLVLGNARDAASQWFPCTDGAASRAGKTVPLRNYPRHGRTCSGAHPGMLRTCHTAIPSLRLVGIGLHDHVMSRVNGLFVTSLQEGLASVNTCFGV